VVAKRAGRQSLEVESGDQTPIAGILFLGKRRRE
jgi:hypothetical protein